MPPAQWPLQRERPVIHLLLSLPSAQDLDRLLIADTGAGSLQSVFHLILAESDCLQCGGMLMGQVKLGGAYAGSFRLYLVNVRIPQLNFDEPVPIVGVTNAPLGFDGIAGIRFLNRFHYGNFGNPGQFALDLLPVP
jgi:hypothetical protein